MAGLPLLTFCGGGGVQGEVPHLTQNNVALQRSFFVTVGTGLNLAFILKILLCPIEVY